MDYETQGEERRKDQRCRIILEEHIVWHLLQQEEQCLLRSDQYDGDANQRSQTGGSGQHCNHREHQIEQPLDTQRPRADRVRKEGGKVEAEQAAAGQDRLGQVLGRRSCRISLASAIPASKGIRRATLLR